MASSTRTVEAIASDVSDLVTFQGSADLRRGVPLARILRSCGRIFADSTGSASTYLLSEPVSRIDVFISHNWAVRRMLKFLALSYHFNFDMSAILALPVVLLLGAATALGLLPVVDDQSGYPIGISCRILCVPCFLVLLLFGRSMPASCGFEGPSVFLDKVCIHQEDAEIKKKGIEKLGAFLADSDRMLVLYSDIYLVRLWTMYEVASFLSQHEIGNMTVVPVLHSACFYAVCMSLAVVNVLLLVLADHLDNMMLTMMLLGITMGHVPIYAARRWHREREAIGVRLSSFRAQDCACFCESDRQVVYSNVAKLMRSCGAVSSSADQEQALDAFNDLACTTLPHAFRDTLGRAPFQPKHYLVLAAAARGPVMLDYLAQLAHGREPREVLAQFIFLLLQIFGVLVVLTALTVLPSFQLHLIGCRSIAWCEACLACSLVFGGLFLNLGGALAVQAVESDPVLALFVAGNCACLLIVIFVQRRMTKHAFAIAPAASHTAGTFIATHTAEACIAPQVTQEAATPPHSVMGRATDAGGKCSL
mmetsp:Transcript_132261/g.423139  ORF Transcript_132261/g.423139 Transcript_132261/m.423139 type:complete len:535 (+) Transcript_132261:103-1707(+)|eukprot:CAMPEP_0203893774 /NCGR_PEP_ID=MMETSP0359-20131031/36805_1 /ASSEMBLY_ACC=CAM_ASM_000338 /TAXON_ID=268821 /ORGANISM="Scrippsiella Hangoei, Strain SHTV-5" /LENGTH=534 /DNA_ID=CAMNT_0050815989 /DNA_START=32 /DNA_END=1636 /DNA_ORIENTATION=-